MSDSDKSAISFGAILSMDGYNRGYDQQVFGLSDAPDTQIGEWTGDDRSPALPLAAG